MASRLRRGILAAAGVGVLAAGGWFGYDWWTHGRFIEETDDAYVGADFTVIAAKVPGYVARVAVVENQRVKAGDVLFTIDDTDYRAQLAVRQSAVTAARAAADTAARQVELQKVAIEQAQANLDSAVAENVRAQADAQRYQSLAATNFGSRQQSELARAQALKAQAGVAASRAAVEAERTRLSVIEAQAVQAGAALQQAQANLRVADINLNDTTVRAPVDGTIGNKTTAEGRYVQPGTQAMVMVPLPNVYVTANFKETQLGAMTAGQAAEVRVDALPGLVFSGRVASFAPASGAQFSLLPPENATGNFTKIVQRMPVRVELTGDPQGLAALRPGMSVLVDVDTQDERRHGSVGRGLAAAQMSDPIKADVATR